MTYFPALEPAQLEIPAALAPLVPPEVRAARSYYQSYYQQHELSLYIHYPFCVRKCPYCDFASLPLGEDAGRDADYIDLLLREFEHKLPLLQGRKFISVYVGGGTPSLCEPAQLGRLLDKLGPYLAPTAEISLEANPGTVNRAKLCSLRAAGFNRISIGVQSFDEVMLKRLGRIHTKQEAQDACRWAKQAGFSNFNIDLMHGLPRQDVAGAFWDVEQALALEPTHLSWYELTLEEGTYFGQHPPQLPDEDMLSDIEAAGFEQLRAAGFAHYEVSAFSLGGTTRCVHNQNYWLYGDYLGLGAGAHQKISLKPTDAAALGAPLGASLGVAREAQCGAALEAQPRTSLGAQSGAMAIWRSANPEALDAYRAQVWAFKPTVPLLFGSGHEVAALSEIVFEYLLNRLRLRSDPVSAAEFYLRTGRSLKPLSADFTQLEQQGLVQCCKDESQLVSWFDLTAQGNLMLNDVLAHFL